MVGREQYLMRTVLALTDPFVRQMLGYDISWAAFNVIEVMSSSKFTFKRMGYLTASQVSSYEVF